MSSRKKKFKRGMSFYSTDNSQQDDSQNEILFQKEYEALTKHLASLKTKIELLRRDHDFLQQEAKETSEESEEYVSYLSKKAEKKQKMIETLDEQNNRELDELRRLRQNIQEKHKDQSNELRKEILLKENQLTMINNEISEYFEIKTLQENQRFHISEMERELSAMRCHHSESMMVLKENLLTKKKWFEQEGEDDFLAFTVFTNRAVSGYMTSHMKEVIQENQKLCEELEKLIGRTHTLLMRRDKLEAQRRQLLVGSSVRVPARLKTISGGKK